MRLYALNSSEYFKKNKAKKEEKEKRKENMKYVENVHLQPAYHNN